MSVKGTRHDKARRVCKKNNYSLLMGYRLKIFPQTGFISIIQFPGEILMLQFGAAVEISHIFFQAQVHGK